MDLSSMEMNYYNQLHLEKCRDKDQTFEEHTSQVAHNLASNNKHVGFLYDSLINQRFLPAGRIQAALGATEREVSPFNCSVSQVIKDDMKSIMAALSNAAFILRLGTGIGFNFSHLRPKDDLIIKLQTKASGPLSFMRMFDTMASTIASSGHRRGAMMGILNVDHPDIEAFIDAKMQKGFEFFNLSVGVSDSFMGAVHNDGYFDLCFNGRIYKTIKARELWDKILNNAYKSAEPGIIFIDRLNEYNNLYYCEVIEATNPCAEQPLPPYGLCTLGSFNLVKYLNCHNQFDFELFKYEIEDFTEAYDNIFDKAVYAIPEHRHEALQKRRIGLGFTGIASAIELMLNKPSYGSPQFCEKLDQICQFFQAAIYEKSTKLAQERGAFPLYSEKYLESKYVKTLPVYIQNNIKQRGIRNSHLISFAPCGTISMYAGNVSSGVEPIFYHSVDRNVNMRDGKVKITLTDYNYRTLGFRGKTLEECTVDDHLSVAKIIQKYTDSAVSKTVNTSPSCTYEEYRDIYEQAYEIGLKGITVYRPAQEVKELRGVVIDKTEAKTIEQSFTSCVGGACVM